MDERLLEEFKNLIMSGYYNAEEAHSEIFSDEPRTSVIVGHLAIANSFINAAHAVYICNNDLQRLEFDKFFFQFSVFSKEVMTNIRTKHSHQWSDIEFNSFVDKFQDVASLLGVE